MNIRICDGDDDGVTRDVCGAHITFTTHPGEHHATASEAIHANIDGVRAVG